MLLKLIREIAALIILFKVEIFVKGRLDLIPSPSPSVKIQIMGRKMFV